MKTSVIMMMGASSHLIPKCKRPKECIPDATNLLDFPQWQAETNPADIRTDADGVKMSEAFWWGEYSFWDGNGDAFTSDGWPAWKYDHYYGFVRMKVVGNKLQQRNVFIYPPVSNATCAKNNFDADNLPKEGLKSVCGVNGAEKVFKAEQDAIDCKGNLAGPYPGPAPGTFVDTKTELIGDGSAILYQASFGDFGLIQSQLTTFPKDGERVRTAQGFFAGRPTYASFYREHRASGFPEWLDKLQEIRKLFNIERDDTCGVDGSTNIPTEGKAGSCFHHFLLDDDEFGSPERNEFCLRMNCQDPTYCSVELDG